MTLHDLLFTEHVVEGKIQISHFNVQQSKRDIYYEGDAEYCYPKDMINYVGREIAYIYPEDQLFYDESRGEHYEQAVICIELCDKA